MQQSQLVSQPLIFYEFSNSPGCTRGAQATDQRGFKKLKTQLKYRSVDLEFLLLDVILLKNVWSVFHKFRLIIMRVMQICLQRIIRRKGAKFKKFKMAAKWQMVGM